jgi:hypothetical protein
MEIIADRLLDEGALLPCVAAFGGDLAPGRDSGVDRYVEVAGDRATVWTRLTLLSESVGVLSQCGSALTTLNNQRIVGHSISG